MLRFIQLSCKQALLLVCLSWSCLVGAMTLGSVHLLSRPGEPLRAEIPIKVNPQDKELLDSLSVKLPGKDAYERLGVSQKILDLNPQAMVYRNRQEELMVLVETVNSVPMTDDPFLDVLVNLTWSSGSINKTYTLLIGDSQKIYVRPGQSLSEIAAQLAPQLDGATIDQTMLALYKANPDAFASGSINLLAAGSELSKPSPALLRSISPTEATQFVEEANAQWRASHETEGNPSSNTASNSKKDSANDAKDRLKIGSSVDANSDERRYTEDLVAQEKVLEQTRAKVAELEKNIADLQTLIDQSNGKKTPAEKFTLGGFGPGLLALLLIGATGLLLWFLARNARKTEVDHFKKPAVHHAEKVSPTVSSAMPDRTKALLAGIDLDLSKPVPVQKVASVSVSAPAHNPLTDTLRVKMNLARAYITIEDFAAAKKSLEEVVKASHAVDPAITIEAQALLEELAHRHA